MDAIHEARVAFCLSTPVGNLVESEVRMLLERLTRGPEGMIDISDESTGDRLVAAVLERADSPANVAALVPLGSSGEPAALGPLLGRAVDRALALARTGPRTILHVVLPPKVAELGPLLADRGFTVAFDAYSMETAGAAVREIPPPLGLRFDDWRPEVGAEMVDDLIRRAFADIPGFLVLPLEDLSERLRTSDPPLRLLFDAERLAGLCRVRGPDHDGVGTISLIARDPQWRKAGLGDALVSEAQRILLARGTRRFTLEVTTDNARALELYKRHGFEPMSIETTWQKPLT